MVFGAVVALCSHHHSPFGNALITPQGNLIPQTKRQTIQKWAKDLNRLFSREAANSHETLGQALASLVVLAVQPRAQ